MVDSVLWWPTPTFFLARSNFIDRAIQSETCLSTLGFRVSIEGMLSGFQSFYKHCTETLQWMSKNGSELYIL